MNYKNLVLLGTSHIARQSLDDVKKHIKELKPDIIALELDRKRMHALMSKIPRKIRLGSIRQIGLKGFLFLLFGAWAEKKLGKLVGVAPGSEMKEAVRIARKEKIELALVDQDIEVTLQRLSKSLTWKEKMNFLADIFKSIFSGKKEIEFDLTAVPGKKIIKQLTAKLKERYPSLYKVLIEERNNTIAQNIKNLADCNPNKKILAILGAGHIDDVLELIKEENDDGSNIRFSFSVG